MSDSVLTALITGGLAFLGVIYANRKTQAETFAKLDKQGELSDAKLRQEIAVMQTQMEELTREVRMHNGFAERIPQLETRLEALERKS